MPEYKIDSMNELWKSEEYNEIIMEALVDSMDYYVVAEKLVKRIREAVVKAAADAITALKAENIIDPEAYGNDENELEKQISDNALDNMLDVFFDHFGGDLLGISVRWSK